MNMKNIFHPTVFSMILKKYLVGWAMLLVFELFALPFSMSRTLLTGASLTDNVLESLCFPIFPFVGGIMAAIFSFRYIMEKDAQTAMHVLPVKKGTLFTSSCLSGFFILIMIEFITAVLGLIVGVRDDRFFIPVIVWWFLFRLLEIVFFYSLAVLCNVFAGRSAAAFAFYMIWNFFFAGVFLVLGVLLEISVFGYTSSGNLNSLAINLSPLLGIFEHVNGYTTISDNEVSAITGVEVHGTGYVAICAVIGILLLIAAYFSYKIRPNESARDVVSIFFAKPMFLYGMGIFGGLCGGFLVYTFFYGYTIGNEYGLSGVLFIMMLIVSIICFMAAQMILKRTWRLKPKNLIGAFGSVAVIAIVVGLFKFDAFGFVSYLPLQDKVSSVYIDFSTNGGMDIHVESDDPEVIEEAIGLHSSIIENEGYMKENTKANHYTDGDESYVFFEGTISYIAKNGKNTARNYYIYLDEDDFNVEGTLEWQVKEFITDKKVLDLAVSYYTDRDDIGNVSYYKNTDDGSEQEYQFSSAEYEKLFDALKKDVNADPLPFFFYLENTSYEEGDINEDTDFDTMYIMVPSEAKNLKEFIEKTVS